MIAILSLFVTRLIKLVNSTEGTGLPLWLHSI